MTQADQLRSLAARAAVPELPSGERKAIYKQLYDLVGSDPILPLLKALDQETRRAPTPIKSEPYQKPGVTHRRRGIKDWFLNWLYN